MSYKLQYTTYYGVKGAVLQALICVGAKSLSTEVQMPDISLT